MPRRNIIIFGASGSGKSSIVNMLTNEPRAKTSNGARGCTFRSHHYEASIFGRYVTLWDTVGFDEGKNGSVASTEAIVQFYTLIRSLFDGVSLLMFVMRAPRIKSSVPQNWKLFREIICQEKVPAVIVITGLEQEENRDQWWQDNVGELEGDGVVAEGHVYITATKGKARRNVFLFEEEYEESKYAVRKLIHSTVLDAPWRVPGAKWFKTTFFAMLLRKIFGKELVGEAFHKLVSVCEMSKADAMELANEMRNADRR